MSGEALGRTLLRLDAGYCAAAGLIAIAAFAPLADLLSAPESFLVAAGVATLAWALLLRRLARSDVWQRPLATVAAANVAAAGALSVLALTTPRIAGQLLLAAAAVEVGAFAGGQLVALRRG